MFKTFAAFPTFFNVKIQNVAMILYWMFITILSTNAKTLKIAFAIEGSLKMNTKNYLKVTPEWTAE